MFAKPPPATAYGPGSDPLAQAAHRSRFLLGSLALHAGVLWTLSQWHSNSVIEASVRAASPQIAASTQAAERHGMRRRVDSLKAMKELMERIERAQQVPDALLKDAAQAAQHRDEAPPAASQAAKEPATPQDMLAQARGLRDSIQKIEQAALAKDMARVLNIPAKEALKRVRQQAQALAPAEPSLDPTQVPSNEQVAQALEHYEQQAREALQHRQQQLAQQANGTPLLASRPQAAGTGDMHGPGASGTTEDQGNGKGDGHGNGKGKGKGKGKGSAAWPTDNRHSDVVDTNPRRYDAPLKPVVTDIAKLRLGYGNVIGSGGAFANRVFIDQWYVIGPFHASDPASMRKAYPPEMLVDLDAVYLGKDRRVLRWQYVSSTAYPLIPPIEAEQAMYYGYTELSSDQARNVWMAFGADDDAKAWVNDKLVWTSGNQAKRWYTRGGVKSLQADIQAANLIEERRRVHLRKGRNTILFKLYNNPLDVFFSLVLEPVADPG